MAKFYIYLDGDWREVYTSGSPSSVDHGSLSGLEDDDHTQYALDTDLSSHADDTSTHGASEIADVSDIAVDSNLSSNAQDAISKRHDRQHSITSTSDHTSTATSGKLLKADANGLPVEASNTDAEVADAVDKRHSEKTNEPAEYVNSSDGAEDAGKGVLLDNNGLIDTSMIGSVGGVTDFGGAFAMINLPPDHALYLDTDNKVPMVSGASSYLITQGIWYCESQQAWYVMN